MEMSIVLAATPLDSLSAWHRRIHRSENTESMTCPAAAFVVACLSSNSTTPTRGIGVNFLSVPRSKQVFVRWSPSIYGSLGLSESSPISIDV